MPRKARAANALGTNLWRWAGEIGQCASIDAYAEQRRDTLPRVKVRPFGKALRRRFADALGSTNNIDADLAEIYDPDLIARQFYKPTELIAPFAFVPLTEADPPGYHRFQIVVGFDDRRRPVMREVIIRTAKELHDFTASQPYRRSRYFESTGEWLGKHRVPTDRYQQCVEAYSPADPAIRKALRESAIDPFSFGASDDPSTGMSGASVTRNIDQEYVPILGGPYCFTGDTKISLLDGTERTLVELASGVAGESFWVYSVTPEGRIIPGHAHSAVRTGVQSAIVEVELDNGEPVRCTPDHRWMLRDGTYHAASELKAGDLLMPLIEPDVCIPASLHRKVVAVRPAGYADVYDLTVDEHHNFALAAGAFVHNSRQLYLYAHWEQTAKAFEAKNHSELARTVITVTSDFALGRGIAWKVKNEKANAIWQEFWDRNGMNQRMRVLADDLTWQGELLLHKFEPLKGFLAVRSFDPGAIMEIVTDIEDIEQVLFYHYQAPCLHGDTLIPLLDGTIRTVAELARRNEPYWVYSWDHKTKRIAPGLASKTWATGRKRCVKVTLDSGASITCSYDHPFLLRDGQTYVEAEQLQVGTSLLPLYRRMSYESVWQPETGWQQTHHMVAGTPEKGMVVHHKSDVKIDNRPENLETMTREAHNQHHKRQRRRTGTMPTMTIESSRQRALASRDEISARKKAWWDAHPEEREKFAAKVREGWANPERRRKMADGISRSRSKPSERLTTLWQDTDWRERCTRQMSESKRKWWAADPERRRRASEKSKARWKDPELRARMGAASKASLNRDELEARARKAVNHKVISVEPAGEHEVYDIQVDGFHNFGLAAGVFTHNTAYQLPFTQFHGVNLNIPLSRYVIRQYVASEILHLKNNVSSTEKWGRSDFYASLGTLKRHRDWTNAATLKGMLQANLIWIITVTGDDADVQAFMSDPSNAQLPAFGGTFVQNQALKLEPAHEDVEQARAMSEGSVGAFLTALFATGQQMPMSYFNIMGRGAARATALVQGEPFAKKIATRQQLIRTLLDHLYEVVMHAAVHAGRIIAEVLRGEDADPEWIFPTIYEEDRGAVFKSLTDAYGMMAISHRSMSVRMAQEAGYESYDYDDEMTRIRQDRENLLLSGRPPESTGPVAQQQPDLPTYPVPPPAASVATSAPSPNGGPPEGQHERLAGANTRARFRRQQRDRPMEGARPVSSLSEADRRWLDAAIARNVSGRVRLPSGKIADIQPASATRHPE